MSNRIKVTVDSRTDVERMRNWFPEADVSVRRRGSWVDIVLLWVMVVGIWPFAHPPHDWTDALGAFDLALHWSAAIALGFRWKWVRR